MPFVVSLFEKEGEEGEEGEKGQGRKARKEGAGGGNGNGAIMHLGRACYNVALGSLSCKCLHSLWLWVLCHHSSRGCILQPAIVVYLGDGSVKGSCHD